MKCPNCKTGNLFQEENEFHERSYKCNMCGRPYQMDKSNHLMPLIKTRPISKHPDSPVIIDVPLEVRRVDNPEPETIEIVGTVIKNVTVVDKDCKVRVCREGDDIPKETKPRRKYTRHKTVTLTTEEKKTKSLEKASAVCQFKRLQRGEIKQEKAIHVIERYRGVIIEEIDRDKAALKQKKALVKRLNAAIEEVKKQGEQWGDFCSKI